MNTVSDKFETSVCAGLEPGSYAHDLAYNVLSSLRKNYSNACKRTATQFVAVITEQILLVRDLEDAGVNFDRELQQAFKALHLFTSRSA